MLRKPVRPAAVMLTAGGNPPRWHARHLHADCVFKAPSDSSSTGVAMTPGDIVYHTSLQGSCEPVPTHTDLHGYYSYST